MHDLKPLILPKLAAARKSSKSSLDMAADPTSSVYSCADSGFYSASECSTPPTPSLYARGHFRYPSSASSLSSSPPTHDIVDVPNASGKLPKLTEEPIEQEYVYGNGDSHYCACDTDFHGHDSNCEIARAYEFQNEYFRSVDAEIRMAKRRRSFEPSVNSISNKIERRFPSLSRKVRDCRSSSSFSRASRSATPSRVPSTRSSSITSSIRHVSSLDVSDRFSQAPTPARASMEQLNDTTPRPMDIDVEKANAIDIDPKQVEAERYAATPLLPPLLVSCRDEDMPASSPLQSPAVADATQSSVATPTGTPPVRAYPTPTLSSKPSVASFKAPRSGFGVSSSDIPPMMLADPNDKWANILGHANFTILPEPYIPERCDPASLRQLFADWEQARCNYAKHQVRTAEHYGVTSKHYLLTEQKWAEIDATWKKNNDLVNSYAAATGHEAEPQSPTEPAPLTKMPTLNDPKSEGKFPKLGDEDIVGPMVQIASPMLKTPSRKRAFFKFLSDFRFPGSFLGKSSAGVRSH